MWSKAFQIYIYFSQLFVETESNLLGTVLTLNSLLSLGNIFTWAQRSWEFSKLSE